MTRQRIALAVALACLPAGAGAQPEDGRDPAAAPGPDSSGGGSTPAPAPPAGSGPGEPGLAAVESGPDEGRLDWGLQLEAGSEYDSNVHRVDRRAGQDVGVDGAPLARLGARQRLTWRRTPRERFALAAHGGLKLFATDAGQTENVAVLSGEGGYEWSLPARGAVLGASGSYYDAIPYHLTEPDGGGVEGRTFRTGTGEVSAALVGAGGHRVTALAGYRAFHYKPDPTIDWRGEHLGLVYQGTLWRGDPDRDDDAASIDLSAGYRVELRDYATSARTGACADPDSPEPRCTSGTDLGRADLNHSLAAEAIYTGRRIYSARYELQMNDSNSFGESLVRQRLRLGFTTELLRELYLTAEATVLIQIYLDPLLIPRDEQALTFISIDEENRNSLSLHLSRPLGRALSVEARYAIYSNEFTNQDLTFRRQTVYAGLVYRMER